MGGRGFDGVGGIISCAHRDPETGALHGHTWEIIAWFGKDADARHRAAQLSAVLNELDHTTLPDRLAWGRQIARHVAEKIGWPCCRVEVKRPGERFYAVWEVDEPEICRRKRWGRTETSRAVVMRGLGFSYAQIARDLKGRSVKSVKRRLQSIAA